MIRESALATADRAKQIFMSQLERAELVGDWHLREGMVAYTTGMHARDFDITILGQTDPADLSLGTRRLVLEALLLESGRPLLILPCVGQFDAIGENVLVGWDGSREAARAVNDAIPILEQARSVVLLTLVYGEREMNRAEPDSAGIISHLAHHGIQAIASKQRIKTKTATAALLDHVGRRRADLLVMGGYGYSRLRAMVLGGTTRAMLRQMTVPVFMAH
jgi:nucleotide-binding universal stress UspA family protein